MHRPDSEEIVDSAFALGKLIHDFGKIRRVTQHADGETWETDAEHTVMLGVMGVAFAKRFLPKLDSGKIAEFALVHDLVEVYAGDTNTFGIATPSGTGDKAAREHAALERIKSEYANTFPWIGETIEKYEKLDTPEACFVKFFDKILPKITHALNKGTVVKQLGGHKAQTEQFHVDQRAYILDTYGKDHPETDAFYQAVAERMVRECFE
jgi:putative hydrolases of HD superfamily